MAVLGFERSPARSHLAPLPGLLEVTTGGSRLRIEPEKAEHVLSLHSTFSLVCYGDGALVWEWDGQPLTASLEHRDGVFVSNLTLRNVTGRHTGEYACTYSPDQAPEQVERKAIYIYVPGRGQRILPSAFPWGLATRRKRGLNYGFVSKHPTSPNPSPVAGEPLWQVVWLWQGSDMPCHGRGACVPRREDAGSL